MSAVKRLALAVVLGQAPEETVVKSEHPALHRLEFSRGLAHCRQVGALVVPCLRVGRKVPVEIFVVDHVEGVPTEN